MSTTRTTLEVIEDPKVVAAASMLRRRAKLDVLDVEVETIDHPGFILRVTEYMAQYRVRWDEPFLYFYAGRVSFYRMED